MIDAPIAMIVFLCLFWITGPHLRVKHSQIFLFSNGFFDLLMSNNSGMLFLRCLCFRMNIISWILKPLSFIFHFIKYSIRFCKNLITLEMQKDAPKIAVSFANKAIDLEYWIYNGECHWYRLEKEASRVWILVVLQLWLTWDWIFYCQFGRIEFFFFR